MPLSFIIAMGELSANHSVVYCVDNVGRKRAANPRTCEYAWQRGSWC